MSKLLTILGATGNQGGSVANYVVADPVLSKEYSIRAVTRDTQKPAAQELAAKGIEVVQGDLDDIDSIKAAFKGAHTVFAVTTTIYDEQLKAREVRQGKAIADAAIEAGVKYLIWSTLSSPTLESKGKYPNVESFDSKYEVEQYIRNLPIKSAFFAPSSFMQNYNRFVLPHHSGDGTFSIINVVRGDTKLPHIETKGDTGKYVGAVLAEPDKFEGKVLSASTDFYSYDDVAETLTRLTGKTVKYNQVPVDVFKGYLPPHGAQCMAEMMLYSEDTGYYGSETKEKVAWTVSVARGKLTTLEEYFTKNIPPALA
ncbi:hypothetical protein EYB26_007851 [Talaromyces marneffei]|uniref:NmrA-like family domain-containing protein 1 n=1 Tax=Talaromyces marneffei PM1 TaxID=1077442 RepID=A0A093UYT8_TALMA|nr:uncharacterized protein EYB26_007851 [Talaromyces marneffei]QGA20150.1 hypothetical protein EYB26_007851 [Talaromyces marneffei]